MEADADSADEVVETEGSTKANGDGGRRSRRCRRRRGRGEMREDHLAAGATDEADNLEEDESAETDDGAADEEPIAAEAGAESDEGGDSRRREGRGRRRGRGRGRGRHRDEAGGFSAREPREEERNEPESGAAVDTGDSEAPIEVPQTREPPYADGANGGGGAPADTAVPAAEPEPAAPQSPALPEPEPVAVVLTPPDPNRPKRAGWWSKAKSVLSGS